VLEFTSAGLSFDYMLLNAFGFFCMAFQDQFGFWAQASYSAEVHVSDLLLSFIGNLFCTFGIVIIFMIPSSIPNKVTWMSMVPNGAALILIIVWSLVYGDLDQTCRCAGMVKAI